MTIETRASLSQVTILKFLILATLAGIICLSPSLKIIPKSLIVTSFHDNQRLVELILLTLVLLFNIFLKKSILSLEPNQTIRGMGYVLIALAIISSTLAISPRHAFIEVCLFAGLSYLGLLIVELYRENSNLLLKRLTYTFLASIVLYMVSFYTGYITATISNTPVTWPNPLTGFSNIRSFNQYQLWTLGLITLPLLAFDFKKHSTRLLLKVVLVSWAVLLFYSASRGALIALVLGIIITSIAYKKMAWPFIRLQLAYLSLGFLSYKILFELVPYWRGSVLVAGTVMRDTTNDRIELWSQALNLIKANPFFGVGPMHFAWYSTTNAHPHNSVLQLMCEWGLPATFLILGIAGYGLFCWFKKINSKNLESSDKSNQNLGIALFFTVITSAIYSLVDGVIVMPISQVMMFTTIGLMIGHASERPINIPKSTSLFRPVFSSIVLIALIWSTWPEILQSASGSEKRFSIGYVAEGPRIWWEIK